MHVGGSITGGASKKNSIINERKELNKLKDEYNSLDYEIKSLSNELQKYNSDLEELEEKDKIFNKYINIL